VAIVKGSAATTVNLDIPGRVTAAEKWLRSVKHVITKKQADEGALHATNVGQMIAALAQAEKLEKAPLQTKLKEIIARYREMATPLVELRELIRERLLPYLTQLETETTQPTTRIGSVGHAVVLRTWWQAEILDKARALKAAANEPEIIEALQRVADRWARESKGLHPLPGTRATETRKGV
jgi:hypothetical protein